MLARSFSRVAWSVENPVLVFLPGVSPSSSNNTVRSCGVEFTLNSCPAASTTAARSVSASAGERVEQAAQDRNVDADPLVLHAGEHTDQGHLDLVVQAGQAVGLERLAEGFRRRMRRRGPRVPPPATPRRLAAEVELPVGSGAVGGQLHPRMAPQQLAQPVERCRPGSSR